MYDALADRNLKVEGLLEGRGYVELLDMMPRMCPVGRTPEFAIVQAARISYEAKELRLRDLSADRALIKYLYENKHLSPFEMVEFSFHVKAPIFVARQWFRHRAASYNEMSQRYVEVTDDTDYYQPSEYKYGVRIQSKTNKQGSDYVEGQNDEKIRDLLKVAESKVQEIHAIYLQLNELGEAKEISRTFLPVGKYTHFIFKTNLRNLFNFLTLRSDEHAQLEIQVYAKAIIEIIQPMFPVLFEAWDETNNSITFSPLELDILKGLKDISSVKSERRREIVQKKIDALK